MRHPILTRLHAASGTAALALIAGFWGASVLSETLAGPDTIAAVKSAVLMLIPAMILCLATAGITGARAGRGWRRPEVARKQRRMAVVAANGVLILLPSAFWLARAAAAGDFGAGFAAIQALELAAGAANIALLSLNLRDGMRLARRGAARGAGRNAGRKAPKIGG